MSIDGTGDNVKWVRDNRGGNWWWAHNAVYDVMGKRGYLDSYGISTYLYLCRRSHNDSQRCSASYKNIAEHTGMSKSSARRGVVQLLDCHMIAKQLRTILNSAYDDNAYDLLPLEAWTDPEGTPVFPQTTGVPERNGYVPPEHTPAPVEHRGVQSEQTVGSDRTQPMAPESNNIKTNINPSNPINKTVTTPSSDDAKIFDLIDALTDQGVSPKRAKQLAQEYPAEMQRRLEYLPHVEIKTSPAQYLSGQPEQEYSVPPALAKQRAEETRLLLAEAQARAAKMEVERKEAAAREARELDEQLDNYYHSLSDEERKDIDEQVQQRLTRVMGVVRDTPEARILARRQIVRKELDMPTGDDEADEQ